MTGTSGFPFDLARGIRMVVLDVDGVLTDGRIMIDDSGDETKGFNVRDGHGIKLLQRAGIEVAILTGRTSHVVEHRARDLGIAHVVQGSLRKRDGIDQLCRAAGIAPSDCAYMGDDVVDLPAMELCRLAMAPADAHPGVRRKVHWVSDCVGGFGAVRQAAEGLILAAGSWQKIVHDAYGLSPQDCGWPEPV